jgi:hypothetical protein
MAIVSIVTTAKSILYGNAKTEPVVIVPFPAVGSGVDMTRIGVPGFEEAGVGGRIEFEVESTGDIVGEESRRLPERLPGTRGAGAAITV